ncbi:MAG TPA: haloacid dehalogenase type II [Hyphomicrobiaceae bacterium]|nr:haloacid dehalogenase type II [Hyphomicrobiaceae bacterium]
MTKVYAFDAYGTLFDVHAAASAHRDEIGPGWERMSQLWRQKHLEYTWIHAMTGRMVPFWTLAARSLDYAIAVVGGVPAGVRDKLLGSYRSMAAFAEVKETLGELKVRGASLAVLSNGDPDMLEAAVTSAGLQGVFDAVISIQDAGVFKPDMAVYGLVTKRFGCGPGDVTFLSSNRWDIAGAHVFGFRTVWINRTNQPDEYPDFPAGAVGRDLRVLVGR